MKENVSSGVVIENSSARPCHVQAGGRIITRIRFGASALFQSCSPTSRGSPSPLRDKRRRLLLLYRVEAFKAKGRSVEEC